MSQLIYMPVSYNLLFLSYFKSHSSEKLYVWRHLLCKEWWDLPLDDHIQPLLQLDSANLETMVVSYPHFGPKNTLSISLLFSNTFKFTIFSTVLQLHTLLLQSIKFLHKIIQKGILVIFLQRNPFSVPTIRPWVFSTGLHKSLVKFAQKPS